MPEDDDLTNEQEQELEKEHFPIRFAADPFENPEDKIADRIREARNKLERLCAPFTDINPYSFLKRLWLSLLWNRKARE
jgi:hypothetical protein